MDALCADSTKRRLVVIGGACLAAAAVAHIVSRRRFHARDSTRDEASETSSKTPKSLAVASHTSVSSETEARVSAEPGGTKTAIVDVDEVTWETLGNWAACLRKKDAKKLPTLLHWTQRLLEERPHDEALSRCLAALQMLYNPGHELVDRVAAVALRASALHIERSLELLNTLFKGRRDRGHRGPKVNVAMVELAMGTLQNGVNGSAERSVYHRAAQLLHFLAENSEGRTFIVARRGHTLMLSAMEKFADDPGVTLEVVCFVRCFTSSSSLDLRRTLIATISALHKYQEKGELQWRILAVLHELPEWDSSDAGLEVAKLAVAAANQHPRFDSVVEWVAKLLCRLAKSKDSGVRNWLRLPTQIKWLETFRTFPHNLRVPNNEAEQWVAELWRLCK